MGGECLWMDLFANEKKKGEKKRTVRKTLRKQKRDTQLRYWLQLWVSYSRQVFCHLLSHVVREWWLS